MILVTGPVTIEGVAVTVDLVILTIREDQLHVLLVQRGIPPYEGELALPGGFIHAEEDIDEAASRELAEETSLDSRQLHLEQLRTYARPRRDPRGRVVTVAYLAVAPDLPAPAGGSDARDASWRPVSEILEGKTALAFDHVVILRDGVERARAKLEYTTVAAAFCPEIFTISDLRRVYEVVWGASIDPRNFHRKVVHVNGFLQPTGEKRVLDTGRPASLYRRGPATVLFPPMLRATPAESPSPRATAA
jgi:8-oxo-dGTP diphosphatase